MHTATKNFHYTIASRLKLFINFFVKCVSIHIYSMKDEVFFSNMMSLKAICKGNACCFCKISEN